MAGRRRKDRAGGGTSQWSAIAICLALSLTTATGSPDAAETRPAEPGTSGLKGVVAGEQGSPASGIRVLLIAIDGAGEPHVSTTDANGRFEIEGAPHGYYELACEADGKAYLGSRVIALAPEKTLEIELRLDTFRAPDEAVGRGRDTMVPGLGVPAAGIARLTEDTGPSGRRWIRSDRGVALLIGGGTLVVGGLIALSGNDEELIVSNPFP